MKHTLFFVAILLFWVSAPSSFLLAGNSLALSTGSGNPAIPEMKADPFLGVFTMSAYGQIMGTVTITHVGGNQYKVDSGDGHDMATKNGLALEGTSQGIPFRILINGNNLTMELLGSAFDLIRISEQSVNQENNSFVQSQSDPFTGTFELFGDNKSYGKIIITCTDGVNYQVSDASSSGVDRATKSGNQLSGFTGGTPFTITTNGNDLSYNSQGFTMQLRRLDATKIAQSTSASGKIDQRLLGLWRYTYVQKSGSTQMVTDYKIGFNNDGSFYTKTSWAGMGTSGEDPKSYGQYQIISMTDSGGIVRLDGKDQEYFFSGGSVKMGSTIYEFIKK